MPKRKREADGQFHHPPKTVEQQSEDSFPASDPPTHSGGSIGAPVDRKTDPKSVTDKNKNKDKERDQKS